MSSVFRRFPAVLIGLVFILSSALKMVDPVGTSLIVEAYLKFLHLTFLSGASMFLAETLCIAEALVGIGLVTGVNRRFFAIATLAMLSFFTIISLLLWIFNPDMHCGCFGEAIHLTHAQTLIKNVVMLATSLMIFLPLYNIGFASKHRWFAFVSSSALMIAFAIYPLVKEPIADFTRFQPSHIIVSNPERYENDFNFQSLPIWNSYGEDCSEVMVEGKVLAISIYRPDLLSDEQVRELAVYSQEALNMGFDNVIALSSSEFEIPGLDTYIADYKDLLTLNRSNGGCVYLSDGYIVKKSKFANFMSREQMKEFLSESPESIYARNATSRSIGIQLFTMVGLACLLLL